MQFIEQYQKGTTSGTVYWVSILLVLSGILVGNFVVGLILTGVLPDSVAVAGNESAFFDLNKSIQLFFLLLPFVFALLAIFVAVKYIHKRDVRSLFTARERFDWKRYAVSFGIWFMVLFVFLVIGILNNSPLQWNFDLGLFLGLFSVSIIMLPLQTAAEDVFFRGYLFQAFGNAFKHAGVSILITGVLFGLLHGANPEVAKIGYELLIYYIASGVFLGVVTHMDDGLELGMGYHAANNLFAALIVTNDWQAFHTDAIFIDHSPPEFGWDALLTLAVIQPILLLIFARIYKWKNWRKKLFTKL